MSFALDPKIVSDTIEIGDLALSRLLLMDDSRFLWLMLVPRRANLAEFIDLDAEHRAILMEEIAAVSHAIVGMPGVDKINVGALGNLVRQLHIHVVGRSFKDSAWPGPVWGSGPAQRYESRRARELTLHFQKRLLPGAAN